jgi:formate-dependent nitrite reductase membrane component NrfD
MVPAEQKEQFMAQAIERSEFPNSPEHRTAESGWFPKEVSEAAKLIQLAGPEGVWGKGYYGLPMLKPPTWRRQIAGYFFLEGISAGSYLIASMAELFGNGKWKKLSRTGFYVAFAALAPCPALLISDLGLPKRFHHMLRAIKPFSPMNLGSWSLTGFGLHLTLICLKQLSEDLRLSGRHRKTLDAIPRRAAIISGLPDAAMMSSYTGVLLSTTSNPLWKKNRFLGVLFACTALSTGVSALYLAGAFGGIKRKRLKPLERIHEFSAAAESTALSACLIDSGKRAAPLFTGRYAVALWAGAVGAGIIAPALLKKRRPKAAAALTLAGGLALKWALVYAGSRSARQTTSAG